MKKILTLIVAAAAISLASCGGKTASTANPDSLSTETVAVEDVPVAEQAQAIVAMLQEQLKNADAEQIKAIGKQVAEKVAEFLAKGDEEAAQTYTNVINNFISENAEQLKAIGASTTISEALSTVEGVPSSIVESATSAANGLLESAQEQAEAAQQAVEAAPEAAKAAAEEAAAAAQQKVEEAAAEAQQKAQEKASKAIDDAASAAKSKLGL